MIIFHTIPLFLPSISNTSAVWIRNGFFLLDPHPNLDLIFLLVLEPDTAPKTYTYLLDSSGSDPKNLLCNNANDLKDLFIAFKA
jgi:hypothetical protein